MMAVRPRTEAPVAVATSGTVIGACVEDVEDAVADGGFEDKRWGRSPRRIA